MASMRTKVMVTGLASGAMLAAAAGTATVAQASVSAGPQSAASANFCAQGAGPQQYKKFLNVDKGDVHTGNQAHRNGWLTGRTGHFHRGGPDDGYFWASGAKHTVYFAAHPKICVLTVNPKTGIAWKAVEVKGLQQQVNARQWNPFYGVTYNSHGQVTKLFQMYHP